MRRFPLGLLAVWMVSCSPIDPMPPDQPCREAGYAIASRTLTCTGNAELSQSRYDTFRKQYTCIEWETTDPRFTSEFGPEDLFGCAYVLSNLPCELVDQYGNNLDAWLTTTDSCALVVEMEGVDTSHLIPSDTGDTGGGQ
jgi:hypothetical protein